MKKKYIIVFICFAVVLISSVVTITILANKLLKKAEVEDCYQIGEVSIFTINNVTNENLNLINFSSNTINETTTQKTYTYSTTKGSELNSIYAEYLVHELEFTNDGSSYTKIYESTLDRLEITLSDDSTSLTIVLTYYYL